MVDYLYQDDLGQRWIGPNPDAAQRLRYDGPGLVIGGVGGGCLYLDPGGWMITPIDPVLQGYWPLNSGYYSGGVYQDTSGNGFDGTEDGEFEFYDNAIYDNGPDAENLIHFYNVLAGYEGTDFELSLEFRPDVDHGGILSFDFGDVNMAVGGMSVEWHTVEYEYQHPECYVWIDGELARHNTVESPLSFPSLTLRTWARGGQTGRIRNLQLRRGTDGVGIT